MVVYVPSETLIETLHRFNDLASDEREIPEVVKARRALTKKTANYPLATTSYDEASYVELLTLKAKVAAAEGQTSASFWERVTNESDNRDGDIRYMVMGGMINRVKDHFTNLGFEATVVSEAERNTDWSPPADAIRWTVAIDWAKELAEVQVA